MITTQSALSSFTLLCVSINLIFNYLNNINTHMLHSSLHCCSHYIINTSHAFEVLIFLHPHSRVYVNVTILFIFYYYIILYFYILYGFFQVPFPPEMLTEVLTLITGRTENSRLKS